MKQKLIQFKNRPIVIYIDSILEQKIKKRAEAVGAGISGYLRKKIEDEFQNDN